MVNSRESLHRGCPQCSHRDPSAEYNLQRCCPDLTEEYVDDRARNPKPADQVVPGSHDFAWWRCRICAHEWSAVVKSRALNGVGCPKCCRSHGEKEVARVLLQLQGEGIIAGFRFEEDVLCRGRLLRYDAVFDLPLDAAADSDAGVGPAVTPPPLLRCAVEFDGEQHFRSVDFGTGPSDLQKGLLLDRMKDLQSALDGTSMLRIAFSDVGLVEQALTSFIVQVKRRLSPWPLPFGFPLDPSRNFHKYSDLI